MVTPGNDASTNATINKQYKTNRTRVQKAGLWKGLKKGTGFMKNRNLYILIAAILVVAVIAVITLLATGRNKNVKDLYFQTETKIFVNFISDIIKEYNDSIAKTKPFREQPSRTRYEISAKISNPGSSANQDDSNNQGSSGSTLISIPEQAVDVINSSKLVLNSRYDLKNDIKTGSLSFLLEGQSFLDINTFLDKDIIGLQIPVLYDKYFVFNKNNVSSALNRFGIDIPVKRILTPSVIRGILTIAPVEFKDIFTDYIKFLEESVTEQHISITRNVKLKQVEYPMNNQNTETVFKPEATSKNKLASGKYDIFTVKLGEDEFKAAAKKTINMLCIDKRLFNITLGKVYQVLEMLKDAGYFDLSQDLETTYNQVKRYEDIDMLKQDLLNMVDNASFSEGFNMTLTVDKSGNMVDRKISFESKMKSEAKRMFNLHTGQFFTKLAIEQESNESQDGNSLVHENRNALIELETVRQDGVGEKFIHINCINNIWPDFEALINTRKTSSEDNKKKTVNTNYILDIDLTCMKFGMEKGNILIDVNKEDRYGIDFKLPEINEDTAIDVKSITDDGIERAKMEIQFSSAKFLLTNQYLINAFTSED